MSLAHSRMMRKFIFLTSLLSLKLIAGIACLLFISFAAHGIERHLAYQMYFYVYWISYALEAILSLLVIYSIFKLAMEPLKGLQTLGMLVFRWVAAISLAVAIGVALTPHLSGVKFMVSMVTQLQQTSSILTLCLLLFVCFAIRPMGLSYRSRIFGVSLGLGLMATVSLVESAWLSHNSNVYSTLNLVTGVVMCLTLLHLVGILRLPGAEASPHRASHHFAVPALEPDLAWLLGDDPGYVAVGGIPPELFAPAELEVMRRASAKMPSSDDTRISG